MDEEILRDRIAPALDAIHSLLARSVDIQKEDTEIDKTIRDMEKKRTE